MLIKIVVVVLLLIIIGSLGSALLYLLKDQSDSTRMVRALSVRIGLSLLAFLLLMAAYFAGLVEPNV